MPKGLTETSSLITIGFSVTETAPNIFTQEAVDLQLNPLDNEVLLVYAIDVDVEAPDAIAATNTSVTATVTTTSQTALSNLSSSTCLAAAQNRIQAAGFVDGGVSFQKTSMETPPSQLSHIGIIATNDFFIQVQGAANLNAKGVSGKMYCARAKASSAQYAALVQSEVLSS
jgi:hypothetical protein